MEPTPNFTPVLLGSDVNVYGMARSFHQEYQIPSVAIGKGALMATANSHIVKVAVIEPRLEEDDVFCRTLISFAKEHEGKRLLLVPCGDNYIKLLVRNQETLRPYYAFTCIDEPLLNKLSLKKSFYQTCTEYGFSFPQTSSCTVENYRKISLPFPFPVVIKPSNSVAYWNCRFPHKKKVFAAQNQAEMDAILTAIYNSSYQDPLILQEYIPGDDSHMRVMNCYCGKDRKVKLIALGEALLEEHSPEGIGSYAAIISGYDEELSLRIKRFLEDIGYTGYANFDMKLDPRDGQYKMFEMNLRQGRSSFFVTAAGYNLARWMADDILLNRPMGLTIAKNRVLWTIIPISTIFKYLPDGPKKEEARRLKKEGKVCHSLLYRGDINPKRLIGYQLNQWHYRQKYQKYFGNKGLHE